LPGWAWCLVDFEGSHLSSAHTLWLVILQGFINIIDDSCLLMWQAAESLSSNEFESFSWGHSGDRTVKNFILACVQTLKTYLPCGNYSTTIEKHGEISSINLLLAFLALINFYTMLSSCSGPQWSIGGNIKSDVEMGLLTSKVCCLIDSLLEYRL